MTYFQLFHHSPSVCVFLFSFSCFLFTVLDAILFQLTQERDSLKKKKKLFVKTIIYNTPQSSPFLLYLRINGVEKV